MERVGRQAVREREGPWRIGELAARVGLSVRALHHYDQIGLVPPSYHTDSGHRRYTAEDVTRLHTVLALRDLGLPLADIKDAIDAEPTSVRVVLRQQLAHLDEQIHSARILRRKIAILLKSDPDGSLSIPALFDLMEGMASKTTAMTAAAYEAAIASRAALPHEERARLVEERRRNIAGRDDTSFSAARANRDHLTP